LYYKDIHALLEGDVAKLKDMSDEDWNKLDRKATWFIRQWLNDTVIVSQQRLQHIPCGRNWRAGYKRKTVGYKAFLF